jgi:hypothetical protein
MLDAACPNAGTRQRCHPAEREWGAPTWGAPTQQLPPRLPTPPQLTHTHLGHEESLQGEQVSPRVCGVQPVKKLVVQNARGRLRLLILLLLLLLLKWLSLLPLQLHVRLLRRAAHAGAIQAAVALRLSRCEHRIEAAGIAHAVSPPALVCAHVDGACVGFDAGRGVAVCRVGMCTRDGTRHGQRATDAAAGRCIALAQRVAHTRACAPHTTSCHT